MLTLFNMKIGEKRIIGEITSSLLHRIIMMGVVPGHEIEILRIYGGLIEIKVGNTHISIRRDLAKMIEVI